MKQAICPEEAAVLRAIRAGQWPEALQAHGAVCTACQETAQLSHWMRGLALGPQENLALPEAGLLWCKALLAQKQAEVERAQKPLEVIEAVSASVIALTSAGWLAWNWPGIQGWWNGLLAGLAPQYWKAGWWAASSAMTLSTSAVLPIVVLCLAVILVAHPLLAGE